MAVKQTNVVKEISVLVATIVIFAMTIGLIISTSSTSCAINSEELQYNSSSLSLYSSPTNLTVGEGVTSSSVTALNNSYISFDGVDDEVQLSSPINLTSDESYSISLWFNADSYVSESGYDRNLYSSRFASLRGTGIQVANNSNTHSIKFKMRNDLIEKSIGFNYLTNQYYHVVLDYNSSNSSFSGFVNGNLIGTSASATYLNSTTESEIGGNNVISGNSEFFDGIIDEVRIYNRTLSDSEITEIYNSGRYANSSLPSDGLVAWYPMNEADGTTVYDNSGNGNNGVLNV